MTIWLVIGVGSTIAIVLAVVVLRGRQQRLDPSPARSLSALVGLLTALSVASGGVGLPVAFAAEGTVEASTSGYLQGLLAQIKAKLLAGLKASGKVSERHKLAKKAEQELAALISPLVVDGTLSGPAADKLTALHGECVAHAIRSMATCYSPQPMQSLNWQAGMSARGDACGKLGLLDKLSQDGTLTPKAASDAKATIASKLAWLEALAAYPTITDKEAKAAMAQKLLYEADGGIVPDEATVEAAAFIVGLFQAPPAP